MDKKTLDSIRPLVKITSKLAMSNAIARINMINLAGISYGVDLNKLRQHSTGIESCRKYIHALENLLNDDEFQKSEAWVEFVQGQIKEFKASSVDTIYSPEILDQEKVKKAISENSTKRTQPGADENKKMGNFRKQMVKNKVIDILDINEFSSGYTLTRMSEIAHDAIEKDLNDALTKAQKNGDPAAIKKADYEKTTFFKAGVSRTKIIIRDFVSEGKIPVFYKRK